MGYTYAYYNLTILHQALTQMGYKQAYLNIILNTNINSTLLISSYNWVNEEYKSRLRNVVVQSIFNYAKFSYTSGITTGLITLLYYVDLLSCRSVSLTMIPCSGRRMSSNIGLSSSSVCTASMCSLRNMEDNTIFSSIKANFCPVKKTHNIT